MANDELNAGFTGTPAEEPTGIRKATKAATDAVVRETTAVATGAADHPHTATTLVLTIGALAFGLGYLMGRSAAANDYSYWR
ncbi:hypothetical protein J2W42_003245 [Rhizobium tibeticum]|uniref:Uncharacterized protein n=1 Tax=Rhizobium tibeticum TaxID=501024 RepID=A0A1H8S5C0_9HYPH|nr:hypothetical protein [Rhizobium tibeticum]MDP9810384.1 hypothetical protein [Rhizobium tibeticum]SEI10422.1 hypothetical protein RTCCBAU85039_4545 [Rhizobium tibeticum]SEO73825.1 hypothetical protein SAMN05216228_102379 [Rhizobium tibeticum]